MFNYETPVLKIWRVWCTPSSPLLPVPFWTGEYGVPLLRHYSQFHSERESMVYPFFAITPSSILNGRVWCTPSSPLLPVPFWTGEYGVPLLRHYSQFHSERESMVYPFFAITPSSILNGSHLWIRLRIICIR